MDSLGESDYFVGMDDDYSTAQQSNRDALLRTQVSELRYIRWLLLFILIMLVTFAVHTLPTGWWYTPWMSV